MIKLLVVDDSAFMRIAIRKMTAADPDVVVVGEARSGRVALAMAEEKRPDIITMDVEMPDMDGLEATKAIMERFPCPIIMISSLTERGAKTTLKALELGAVDFIPKKSSFVQLDIVQIGEELLHKIRFWHERRVFNLGIQKGAKQSTPACSTAKIAPAGKIKLAVIGLSTGGPAVLPVVLKAMGRLSCPVVVAQHMPPIFTASFAKHLSLETGLNVVEGTNAMSLEPGMVVIAPGAFDSMIREPFPGRLTLAVKLKPELPIHPSVDALFLTAASLSVPCAAAILTGMGNDGTEGALALAKKGVPVLVQESSSCVVDGMPSSALKAGAASDVLTPEQIGSRLKKWGE